MGKPYLSMRPYTRAHAGNKSGLTGLKEFMQWEDLEGTECGGGKGLDLIFKKIIISPMKISMIFLFKFN